MLCTICYYCVCMFSTMCTVHYMLCIFTFIILIVLFVKMLQQICEEIKWENKLMEKFLLICYWCLQ